MTTKRKKRRGESVRGKDFGIGLPLAGHATQVFVLGGEGPKRKQCDLLEDVPRRFLTHLVEGSVKVTKMKLGVSIESRETKVERGKNGERDGVLRRG